MDTERVPRWAWLILVGVFALIMSVGAYKYISQPAKPASPAITAPAQNQAATPDNVETSGKPEKFLIFAVLGALLLGIAFIPRLPAGKLLGAAGALLLLLGALMWAICWTWPDLLESGSRHKGAGYRQNAISAPAASVASSPLPASAKFIKTLAPGERIYLTRASLTAPPPERWYKFPDGRAARFAPWPSEAKHRYAQNGTGQAHDLYVVLPAGQSVTASATDPALAASPAPPLIKTSAAVKMAPAKTALAPRKLPPPAVAVPKPAVIPSPATAVPKPAAIAPPEAIPPPAAARDPFQGKYRWNGKVEE